MTRFEKAEAMRQAALDYINANPGVLAPQLMDELKWDKHVGAGRLADMTDTGELSRVKSGHTYAYKALVTKTRSASENAKRISDNLKCARRPKPLEPEIHFRDPKRKPIPGQGGQGAVRHEIRRGCSLS